MKVYIAPCKVLRIKEFPTFDTCTLSTNNFVCFCLISLYLIHAPLFFLVTKVEMQLSIPNWRMHFFLAFVQTDMQSKIYQQSDKSKGHGK